MDVHGVWILDQTGKVIFSYEIFIQGSENYQSALLANLVTVLQQFANQIGKKEIKLIELSNSKIFIQNNEFTKNHMVLRCGKDILHNIGYKALDNIKNILDEVAKDFNPELKEFHERLRIPLESYINELLQVEPQSSMKKFLHDF